MLTNHIMNHHHCEHLKSHTKNYEGDEMSHWEKLIVEEQYIVYIVFHTTYFFNQLYTLLYIMSQKN